MTPEFAYLLKVNVAFVLFYAFYRLFFYCLLYTSDAADEL